MSARNEFYNLFICTFVGLIFISVKAMSRHYNVRCKTFIFCFCKLNFTVNISDDDIKKIHNDICMDKLSWKIKDHIQKLHFFFSVEIILFLKLTSVFLQISQRNSPHTRLWHKINILIEHCNQLVVKVFPYFQEMEILASLFILMLALQACSLALCIYVCRRLASLTVDCEFCFVVVIAVIPIFFSREFGFYHRGYLMVAARSELLRVWTIIFMQHIYMLRILGTTLDK